MKRQIKIWLLRLTVAGLMCLGLILGIILNPSLLYANKTIVGNFTIYHNVLLDDKFIARLDNAANLVSVCELFDPNIALDICLNDGSLFPKFVEKLRGQAFGWGFYNKVVLMGNSNCKDDFVELNGYKWNLTQLLVHEATHCLQFHKFGLWKSNPLANYPNWKWEGYPEYVARRNAEQLDLTNNISRKIAEENLDKAGWAIRFGDSTISPRIYYNDWLLIQYCLGIKKMTYEDLLLDTTDEQTISLQMKNWFTNKKYK